MLIPPLVVPLSPDAARSTMKIRALVPLLCLGGAYALPVLPWLAQLPIDGLVRYWGWLAPGLEEDRTIYQVLKDDER